MPLLEPDGANYIGVRDLPSATARYIEKLGLRKVQVELDNGENCIALGFSKEQEAVVLGPVGGSSGESGPLLYTGHVKKAQEFLASRGVQVGEIQQDRQGTHFFEMHDLEGNVIEVSEMP